MLGRHLMKGLHGGANLLFALGREPLKGLIASQNSPALRRRQAVEPMELIENARLLLRAQVMKSRLTTERAPLLGKVHLLVLMEPLRKTFVAWRAWMPRGVPLWLAPVHPRRCAKVISASVAAICMMLRQGRQREGCDQQRAYALCATLMWPALACLRLACRERETQFFQASLHAICLHAISLSRGATGNLTVRYLFVPHLANRFYAKRRAERPLGLEAVWLALRCLSRGIALCLIERIELIKDLRILIERLQIAQRSRLRHLNLLLSAQGGEAGKDSASKQQRYSQSRSRQWSQIAISVEHPLS